MGEKSLLSRLLAFFVKRGNGQKACRGAKSQAQAQEGNSSAEKLLLEMKFGKR